MRIAREQASQLRRLTRQIDALHGELTGLVKAHALHIIAITRTQRDPTTQEHLARKEAEPSVSISPDELRQLTPAQRKVALRVGRQSAARREADRRRRATAASDGRCG